MLVFGIEIAMRIHNVHSNCRQFFLYAIASVCVCVHCACVCVSAKDKEPRLSNKFMPIDQLDIAINPTNIIRPQPTLAHAQLIRVCNVASGLLVYVQCTYICLWPFPNEIRAKTDFDWKH